MLKLKFSRGKYIRLKKKHGETAHKIGIALETSETTTYLDLILNDLLHERNKLKKQVQSER